MHDQGEDNVKQNKHDVFFKNLSATYSQTVLLFILIILRREVQSSDIRITWITCLLSLENLTGDKGFRAHVYAKLTAAGVFILNAY